MKKLILPLLAILLFGCQKQEINILAPKIIEFGVSAPDTTIKIGATINFAPKIQAEQSTVTQSWSVENKIVGTANQYQFKADQAGVYKLIYTVKNETGSESRELIITVKSYVSGFYILNEGWFGHETGSVNHFDPSTGTLSEKVYAANNSPLELGATTCFGTRWNGSIYFMSKQGHRLVVADELSMRHRASLDILGAGDGRAFAGVDENNAVITTSKGAYQLAINTLAVGSQLDQTSGKQCGGVFAADDHVFVIVQGKGINIYSVSESYKLVKNHPTGSVGFARAKDGSLWAAEGSKLIKIDTKTLSINEIAMPTGVAINNSWGAWNAGSLQASTIENVLFFAKSGPWGGGNEIYRYQIGNTESLNAVFLKSTVADDSFYGSGIGVDPVSGDIVATFLKEGYADFDDNRIVIFDGKTGVEKSRKTFKHYYFPAMIIFNN